MYKINLRDPTIYSTILSLIGAFMVSSSESGIRFYGFITWIISNCIWAGYFFKTKQYNPMILFLVYIAISIMGVINNVEI